MSDKAYYFLLEQVIHYFNRPHHAPIAMAVSCTAAWCGMPRCSTVTCTRGPNMRSRPGNAATCCVFGYPCEVSDKYLGHCNEAVDSAGGCH